MSRTKDPGFTNLWYDFSTCSGCPLNPFYEANHRRRSFGQRPGQIEPSSFQRKRCQGQAAESVYDRHRELAALAFKVINI